MSHKDRSIRGSRCEAKRIYNQRRYINKLEQENKELKEENFKLQARSDRFINYWNKLKEWLEKESKLKGTETAYLYYGRTLDKMQEIEGGIND